MARGNIKEAFFTACGKAQPARQQIVSLYVDVPYYGGPEEGGWWGSDTNLIAFQIVATEAEAVAVKAEVESLAADLCKRSKRSFGEQCVRECEWLDARGLDADFLPEVDGESRYWVATEETPGSCNSTGCRHYE